MFSYVSIIVSALFQVVYVHFVTSFPRIDFRGSDVLIIIADVDAGGRILVLSGKQTHSVLGGGNYHWEAKDKLKKKYWGISKLSRHVFQVWKCGRKSRKHLVDRSLCFLSCYIFGVWCVMAFIPLNHSFVRNNSGGTRENHTERFWDSHIVIPISPTKVG